ncbi:hypothetical protein GPL15_23535 [Clostridium sp. MCC353]|uniref:hypothetical protein n=1 Tax=Clostridium sp. MCC353 TaxID=2592646 RepID=UPI001C0277E2|nr:hypothetical protein [Clostridium sp. MCC353]MBT9779455.1 hypothetical protein [Clostridium sp. MCC353]
MGAFGEALKKAGITGPDSREYDRKKITAFTLEMKLYEMKDHIDSMKRIYRKYLNAEGTDRLDYRDSLANRFGYMVIAFQDIMESVMEAEGEILKNEDISIRRAIGRFQSLFPGECENEEVDNAVTSMSDRNEIVHAYENYKGNMETVMENVANYSEGYEAIFDMIWEYCRRENLLKTT